MTTPPRVTRPPMTRRLALLGRLMGYLAKLTFKLQLRRLREHLLKPRPGDIYIVTCPKSGTTLMQMIVYQLVTGGRGEFEHILQVSPYLEQLMTRPYAEKVLNELPSPRIMKSHLNYEDLRPPRDSKVIYVTRNEYDTLLSAHHHMSMGFGARLDFNGFFFQTLNANPWSVHLSSWWPHRNDENVLHVRYEDALKDLEGTIRKVAAFCGIPVDESRMGDILEKCGLDYMKQHTHRFDFRLPYFDPQGLKDGFVRKSGEGSGRATLSPQQRAALGKKVAPLRKKLGITDGQL
jgi:hypothetical protein